MCRIFCLPVTGITHAVSRETLAESNFLKKSSNVGFKGVEDRRRPVWYWPRGNPITFPQISGSSVEGNFRLALHGEKNPFLGQLDSLGKI